MVTDGDIMEGDVVEYPLPEEVRQGGLYGGRSYGIGAVHELALDNSSSSLVCHIEPLVMVFSSPPSYDIETSLAFGSNFLTMQGT